MAGEDAERRAYRRRLGFTLARVRTRLTDYTQETLAAKLGVDVETVGRWERGEREPKAFELHRIADDYDVPGDWFLFPTDSVTELDERIEARRDQALAAAAVDAAREDLEVVEEAPPAAASKRVAQRGKRPA